MISKKGTLFLLLSVFNVVVLSYSTSAQTPDAINLLPNGVSFFSLQGAALQNAIVEKPCSDNPGLNEK